MIIFLLVLELRQLKQKNKNKLEFIREFEHPRLSSENQPRKTPKFLKFALALFIFLAPLVVHQNENQRTKTLSDNSTTIAPEPKNLVFNR